MLLDVIRRYNSINDLEAFMIDTIDVVTSNIATNHSQRDRKLITSIKEYISANPKTSLTDVAEHFHHSSCYLSHIFPKETRKYHKKLHHRTTCCLRKRFIKKQRQKYRTNFG